MFKITFSVNSWNDLLLHKHKKRYFCRSIHHFMKKIWILAFLLTAALAKAQETPKTTASFQITGKVKNSITVQWADLQQYPVYKIGNVKITSHTGEPRGEFKKLKGILLKDVIAKANIEAENPKILSEYYIICEAADGYKNVYSWNELFNTEVGIQVFIVTEENGQSFANSDKNIMLISPKDFRTGRRNLKGLSRIDIKRI